MCTQAPAPDWLAPVLNQSGVLKFVYPGAGAWVHIYVPRRRRLGTHYVPRRRRLGTHFGSFCTECYPSESQPLEMKKLTTDDRTGHSPGIVVVNVQSFVGNN